MSRSGIAASSLTNVLAEHDDLLGYTPANDQSISLEIARASFAAGVLRDDTLSRLLGTLAALAASVRGPNEAVFERIDGVVSRELLRVWGFRARRRRAKGGA